MGRRLPALVLVAATCVAAWPDLARPGYSPDEEYTLYALRGIAADGLPLLPSNLLYDRGLVYSYAAWLASTVTGPTLAGARAVSLAAGLFALSVLFVALRRHAGTRAAVFATVLSGASLPFWASVTAARFYGPFLLFYVLSLAACAGRGAGAWLALAAASAGARASHELAFTFAGVPVLALLAAPREERAHWLRHTAAVLAGLAASQAVLTAVHYLAPSSGGTMVKRFFLWQVLNILETPPLTLPLLLPAATAFALLAAVMVTAVLMWQRQWVAATVVVPAAVAAAIGQFGVAGLAALCVTVWAPSRARTAWRAAGLVTASAVAFWLMALVSSGRPASSAVRLAMATGFIYPLDMLRYLIVTMPLLTAAACAVLLLRASGRGGPWSPLARMLHALWICWVLWFGVMESGITARYLLVPVTVMLAALGVDITALTESRVRQGVSPSAAWAAPVLTAFVLTAESWLGVPSRMGRFAEARPTIHAPGLSDEVLATDLVAGNDELACLLLAGRIDAWLTLDDFFRERFIVQRDGRAVGVYTAAPAADTIAPLLVQAGRTGGRLLIVDVVKDVPGFGSSAPLVARALLREGLDARTLAVYSGVRLLEVVRPEALAALRRRAP